MASVTIITQLHCAATGKIDLPEGKTWGDVTDWYVKWGRAHLTFKGGETEEIDCNPDIGDSVDWKRPIHAEIYANDASGEPDFSVMLDERG